MITAEKWYQANPDDMYFYQGDIIRDVPYPFWPNLDSSKQQTKWGLLRPYKQEDRPLEEVLKSLPALVVARAAKEIADAWAAQGREYVAAAARKMNVMIISRSCSLDNPTRKHFAVVPVIALEELKPEQKSDGKLKELRQNGIPQNFYLPAKDGLGESYADFLTPATIHRSFFDPATVKAQLVARLSCAAAAALQNMLSSHFGTRFGFDHEDECPQTGNYSCSNCFHSGMAVKPRQFTVADVFGPCDQCGEDAMWIRLPSNSGRACPLPCRLRPAPPRCSKNRNLEGFP